MKMLYLFVLSDNFRDRASHKNDTSIDEEPLTSIQNKASQIPNFETVCLRIVDIRGFIQIRLAAV